MVKLLVGNIDIKEALGYLPDSEREFILDEDSIKIGSVRELQGKLALKGEKSVLIFGADRLTPEASNALLKTLEEPRIGTNIVLTSPSELSLLPTIVSRCEVVRLNEGMVTVAKPDSLSESNIDDWIIYARDCLFNKKDSKYLLALENLFSSKSALGKPAVSKKLVLENLSLKLFNKISYGKSD
tara:strand:+ start:763 stop:1314 length:552 start_codon:yes stop_codon:yes gene_type:complete